MANFEKDAACMWQLENTVSNDTFIFSIPLAKERKNEWWLDWALFLVDLIAAEDAFTITKTHFCQPKVTGLSPQTLPYRFLKSWGLGLLRFSQHSAAWCLKPFWYRRQVIKSLTDIDSLIFWSFEHLDFEPSSTSKILTILSEELHSDYSLHVILNVQT